MHLSNGCRQNVVCLIHLDNYRAKSLRCNCCMYGILVVVAIEVVLVVAIEVVVAIVLVVVVEVVMFDTSSMGKWQ